LLGDPAMRERMVTRAAAVLHGHDGATGRILDLLGAEP
jgi:hypothetical protein